MAVGIKVVYGYRQRKRLAGEAGFRPGDGAEEGGDTCGAGE